MPPEPVNSPYFNNFLEANHARIHQLHLFPPHIAERGLLYFQQGKVRDVEKTSSGRYRAEVCGSENYWVWLKLDSDLYIKDGGCDCPYGGVVVCGARPNSGCWDNVPET